MRSFKSNEKIHKKEGGSYYLVSANKAQSFPRRTFRGPNYNGSNCSEATCQEPSCPVSNIAERLHKVELSRAYSSEPSFFEYQIVKQISVGKQFTS